MQGNDSMGKHIDPHVHCRDWKWSYKATIKSVMDAALSQGVDAVVDMPNTDPPITSRELAEKRLETARAEGVHDGYYIYMGVTKDQEQLRKAVDVVDSNPKVVGLKMFAGRSVGSLGVVDEQSQRDVYSALAESGYKGVLMLHCEKESMFKPEDWDPRKPYTWNMARPPAAEAESVRDQLRLASECGVRAHIHICHISVPESVNIVDEARKHMDISCGVTPHHLTLSTKDMQDEAGVVYKVNPPLRDPGQMEEMLGLLKKGKIDFIETDHAPHTREEKEYSPSKKPGDYLSGIPSLNGYSEFLDRLKTLDFSENEIEKITYLNVKRVFPKITQ